MIRSQIISWFGLGRWK